MVLDPIQNRDLDLSGTPLAGLGIYDLAVPAVVIVAVIRGLFGCVIDVAVVGLEHGGPFVYQVLQDGCSGFVLPGWFITLHIGPENDHLGRLVILSHPDILVLWQIFVQEDLLDDERDGPFHSFPNAPVEELGVVLDVAQIFLSEGQQLDGEVLYGDVLGVVYAVIDAGISNIMTINIGVVAVDGDRSGYFFGSVGLFMPVEVCLKCE